MPIVAFDHLTLRCADLPAAWRFYADVLGLHVVERPGLNVPAAIVYLGDAQLLHLFQATPEQDAIFARLRPPVDDAEAAQWGTARLHHLALQARGLADLRARLSSAGFGFTERTLTGAGKHLILVKDPDHLEIELAFGLDEVAAA
ncbi:MAG TPA: VOC family protein [Chloroflexota bacterium]|jgi:catechol 2,3-dioxygenase-like lactoylglutathione lyase family enzyme